MAGTRTGRARDVTPRPGRQTTTASSDTGTAIVADARDRRRARTVRRLATIELVDLIYGGIPAEQWCRWCHGRCQVVSA